MVWEGPSVVKYKVTDTLRMESVGAGVGMSEEEVRELVSRPAGSKYALEEITGALNWVRRAMMNELGTEITIAPDCTRCRRPLSTHTPDTVCVAEEVEDTRVYMSRNLTRIRDALSTIDAKRGNEMRLTSKIVEQRQAMMEKEKAMIEKEKEWKRREKEMENEMRKLRTQLQENEKTKMVAATKSSDTHAVEEEKDATEKSGLNSAPTRVVVLRDESTHRKEVAPAKETPEMTTPGAAAPGVASTSAVLEPKIVFAGGPPDDPSSSDSDDFSSGDDDRRQRRRRKRSWRDEKGRKGRKPSRDASERKDERKIVPESSKEVKDEKKVPIYPQLYELEEDSEYCLKHMKGGRICGGTPNNKKFRDLLKVVDSIDFYKKTQGETPYSSYVNKVKQFFTSMENGSDDTTCIYEYVAVFSEKNYNHHYTLRPLKQKEAYYTSFRHFVDEFIAARFPDHESQSMIDVERCSQKPDEDISSYYERFCVVKEDAAWPPKSLVGWFMSGLHDKDVKEKVQMYSFINPTIEAVRDYAIELTGLKAVKDALNSRRNDRQRNHPSNASARSRPQVSAASGAIPKQTQQQQSQQRQGRQQQRSQQQRQRSNSAPAASEDKEAWLKRFNTNFEWMRSRQIYACPRCGRKHRVKFGKDRCVPDCPICGMKFKGDASRRHWWTECRRMPDDDDKIRSIISEVLKQEAASK